LAGSNPAYSSIATFSWWQRQIDPLHLPSWRLDVSVHAGIGFQGYDRRINSRIARYPFERGYFIGLGVVDKGFQVSLFPPGSFERRWNGRDDGGHFVAQGVFCAVYTAGKFRETLKLTIIR